MNSKLGFHWLVIIFLIFTSCNSKGSAPEGNNTSNILPNMLVEVEGKVELRRIGWSNFVSTGFGTLVSPGDLIRVPVENHAVVFCGDESTWGNGLIKLPSDGKEHGIPCKNDSPPRPSIDTALLRGKEYFFVPYVISPRNSALFVKKPKIQWNILPNIEKYILSIISDDDIERSPVQAEGGEIDWPEQWPPIEHQANYVLVVQGDNHISNENNTENIGLGFWLLSEEKREQVRSVESRILSLEMNKDAADRLIAEMYLDYGLYSEATQLLESILNRSTYCSVWLALGNIYFDIGLENEAYYSFNKAKDCSNSSGELEVEADALLGLGLAGKKLDDPQKIKEHLMSAKEIFKHIGHEEGLEKINKMIIN